MSTISKITLGLSCTITISIVAFVHLAQQDEKKRMRLGVIRDQERQERKRQNAQDLKEQQRLEAYFQEQEQSS